MRLRSKIPAILVPIVVVPLAVIGWLVFQHVNEDTKDRLDASIAAALARAADLLDSDLVTARGNLQLLSGNVLVNQYALTGDENVRYSLLQKPLLDLFSTYQDAFPNYFEIRYLTTSGFEDVRQVRPYRASVSDEEGASEVFRGLAAAGPAGFAAAYVNPDDDQPALFVGVPILRRDQTMENSSAAPKLRGYLAISVALKDFANLVRSTQIGKSGFLFSADDEGRILFGDAARPLTPALRQATDKILGSQQPTVFSLHDRPLQIVGKRLTTGLNIFAAVPVDDVQSATYSAALTVGLLVVFTVAICGGGLIVVLNNVIVRPVQRLRTLAAEIGNGNLDIKSGISSKDEVGQLAHSFEEMAGNLKAADDRVRFLAYHDNLTGLPNRVMFRDSLTRTLAQAQRAQEKVAILFLDIDGFKYINDTIGHEAGDRLLQEIAKRLTLSIRQSDILIRPGMGNGPDYFLARLGGDEFIALLTGIRDIRGPAEVARRFIDTVSEKFEFNGIDCHVGASIGIAIFPDDGTDANDLIKHADIAMYHAKKLGKNTYQYFQESMNAALRQRATVESKLRKGIGEGELSLHYQPQVNPLTNEIVGLEALVRWNNPDIGTVSPAMFIPLAEETGLIIPLGEWVIDEACRQAREWDKQGLRAIPVSINISGVQFERHDVAELLKRSIARHQVSPSRIEVEITESAIVRHPERAIGALQKLVDNGVGVALDDFGTGYSSLSYLRRFPISTVKIDRSFVLEIDKNREDAEIVAAIVAMAHTLGMRVIAEGVETQDQLTVIVGKHCDVVQGYIFSRPLPASKIPELLRQPLLRSA